MRMQRSLYRLLCGPLRRASLSVALVRLSVSPSVRPCCASVSPNRKAVETFNSLETQRWTSVRRGVNLISKGQRLKGH